MISVAPSARSASCAAPTRWWVDGRSGAWIDTTDDAHADVARMAAFYARFTARRPENAGPVRLRN